MSDRVDILVDRAGRLDGATLRSGARLNGALLAVHQLTLGSDHRRLTVSAIGTRRRIRRAARRRRQIPLDRLLFGLLSLILFQYFLSVNTYFSIAIRMKK